MQFLLDSAIAALSSRIDAHTLAGPQRVFAFPQDVVSQASKASPKMQNEQLNHAARTAADGKKTSRQQIPMHLVLSETLRELPA